MLRRFLDGLYDDKARFQVEYVKEPRTIDDAVFFVVDFEETRRRPSSYEGIDRKNKRQVRNVAFSDTESEFSESESEQSLFVRQKITVVLVLVNLVTKIKAKLREIVPRKEIVPHREILPYHRRMYKKQLTRLQIRVRLNAGCLKYCRKYQNLRVRGRAQPGLCKQDQSQVDL